MAAPGAVVAHCIGDRKRGGLSARCNRNDRLRLQLPAKSNPYIAQRV